MTNTIYIHQPEKAFSFTRLPNFLFEAPTFQPLSNEAKVLYAFVLRRAELSRKNGWADEYGRVYLYYPICEVVALLRCGRQKAVNTLRELQYAGLVEIQKQGCGKPNRIMGGGIGLLKGVLVVGLVCWVILRLGLVTAAETQESVFLQFFSNFSWARG